jgi:hypothetical protein
MSQSPKMPRPIQIQRKLTLSSERIVSLREPEASAIRCTKRQTGCPIHTC